jgi:hypothetical protein
MSDFKFSCPKCGQKILCDTSNAGMQIPCPACQTSLTVPPPPPAVPAAGGKLGINKTAHVHQAPPPPPPGAAGAPAKPAWGAKAEVDTGPQKTSALAVASLACSLSTFVTGIGFIPGIICGHMAKARIRRDSSLKGMGLAKWGLITGYLILVLGIVGAGGAVGWGIYTAKKMQEELARQAAEQQAEAAAKAAAAAAEAKRGVWKMDLSAAEFPDHPASGKLHTVNFTADTASFQAGTLALLQGGATSRSFFVSSLLKAGESITNRTFNITPADTNRVPRVSLVWKDVGAAKTTSQIFTNGYAMKLEFGQVADGKLPGKIYLSVPDPEQSYVGGTFEITLKAPAPPAAVAGQRGGPGQPGGGAPPGGGGRRRGQ